MSRRYAGLFAVLVWHFEATTPKATNAYVDRTGILRAGDVTHPLSADAFAVVDVHIFFTGGAKTACAALDAGARSTVSSAP